MQFKENYKFDIDEVLDSFEIYLKDPTRPSRWDDVFFVCNAVLKAALAAFEGRCNFSTARQVCQMFDLLVLERTIESTKRLSWEEIDLACETAWPWREILNAAVMANPDVGFDDPAAMTERFFEEADYYNFVSKVECHVYPEDLYLLNCSNDL